MITTMMIKRRMLKLQQKLRLRPQLIQVTLPVQVPVQLRPLPQVRIPVAIVDHPVPVRQKVEVDLLVKAVEIQALKEERNNIPFEVIS
jgi:hypothetical protein